MVMMHWMALLWTETRRTMGCRAGEGESVSECMCVYGVYLLCRHLPSHPRPATHHEGPMLDQPHRPIRASERQHRPPHHKAPLGPARRHGVAAEKHDAHACGLRPVKHGLRDLLHLWKRTKGEMREKKNSGGLVGPVALNTLEELCPSCLHLFGEEVDDQHLVLAHHNQLPARIRRGRRERVCV